MRRGVLALGLVLVVGGVVLGYQAWQAASGLLDARKHAVEVEDLVRTGDFDAATRQLAVLREDTRAAADATDGVLWDLGRHLPVVGDDLAALQTASSVLDNVTRQGTPLAIRLSRAVADGRLRPHQGRIDLAALRRLAPTVTRAADDIAREHRRLDAIDVRALGFPFEQPLRELFQQVRRVHEGTSATATAFELMPRMLGAREPRSYLLLVQNNAEIRSTGGIPGSLAVLHAEKGRLRMGWQGGPGDLHGSLRPAAPMARSAVAVYGRTMLTDLRDSTFNPDFPEVARVAAAMLERATGQRVDGVVSVDPMVLAYLLQSTGPVEVGERAGKPVRLNHTNAVRALLNLTYQLLPDQEQQNDFFERTARAVFDRVTAGGGNSRLAVTALATGVEQRRVLLWSRHPAEQREIAGTAVSGALPGTKPADEQPHVGLYLNDATAAKAQFYLDYQPALESTSCTDDGRQQLTASVALTSSMPRKVDDLSFWITGTGRFAPKGTIAVNLRVYGPAGGSVTGLTVDGQPRSITADRHKGRQVAVVPLRVDPGQRVVVQAELETAPGQHADPVLTTTPGLRNERNGVEVPSSC